MECKLEEILSERGVKQKWLADKVGMNKSPMSNIVRGKTVPTLKIAIRIAQALDLHVEEIWYET